MGAVRFLMRNKQKRVMMAVWDMVILRLLIPACFTLQVPFSFLTMSFDSFDRFDRAGGFPFYIERNGKLLGWVTGEGWAGIAGITRIARSVGGAGSATTYGNWIKIGVFVVSFGLVFGYCVLAFCFSIRLRSGKQVCYSDWIRRWLAGKQVSIFESWAVSSACTCGVLKPIILCSPFLGLEGEDAFLILEHERKHIFHHDMIRKHLVQILVCFHWFNPVFWILRKWVLDDMEMACDEAVIQECGDFCRGEYARLLVSTVREKEGVGGNYFNRNCLKERVMHVMRFQKGRVLTVLGVAIAVGLIGGSCLNFVTYEGNASSKEQESAAAFLAYEGNTSSEEQEGAAAFLTYEGNASSKEQESTTAFLAYEGEGVSKEQEGTIGRETDREKTSSLEQVYWVKQNATEGEVTEQVAYLVNQNIEAERSTVQEAEYSRQGTNLEYYHCNPDLEEQNSFLRVSYSSTDQVAYLVDQNIEDIEYLTEQFETECK